MNKMSDSEIDLKVKTSEGVSFSTLLPPESEDLSPRQMAGDTEGISETTRINEPEMKKTWFRHGEGDEPVLEPDHPLMKRFQAALKAHLERQNARYDDEVKKLEEDVKRQTATREEMGVRLYGLQQDVATQQRQLDKYHDQLAELTLHRQDADEALQSLRSAHQKQEGDFNGVENKEVQLRAELRRLADQQRQFSEWAEEMRAEVAVSQRIAEKDKTDRRVLSEEKRKQDVLLYKLTSEISNLREQLAMLDGQFRIKEQERATVGEAAADGAADLEALQAEQTRLSQAWRGVVLLLRQRDRVYDSVKQEKHQVEESARELNREIEAVRRMSRAEMERNEKAVALLGKLMVEQEVLSRGMAAGSEKRVALEKELAEEVALQRQTEAELARVQSEGSRLASADNLMRRDVEAQCERKLQLEAKLVEKLTMQLRNDKAAQYLHRAAAQLRDDARDQALALLASEHAAASAELEAARRRADLVRGKRFVEEMRREGEAAEREVDDAEVELDRINKTITKKHSLVLQLANKLEALVVKAGGQEMHPLERRLNDMEMEQRDREREVHNLQQFWLRQQGHVVGLSQQRSDQLARLALLRKQVTILDQKNLKMEREIERANKEASAVQRSIGLLFVRLGKCTRQLADKSGRREELGRGTALQQEAYLQQLADAEASALSLQAELEQMEAERGQLAAELLEAQRRQLAWEKKLKLAEQAGATVRAERGREGEIAAMRLEIHRMTVRLAQLARAQERLTSDLEQCVARREHLADSAGARERRLGAAADNSRVAFARRLDELRVRTRALDKETETLSWRLGEVRQRQGQLLGELEDRQKQLAQLEAAAAAVDARTDRARQQKQHNLEWLVRAQRHARLLGEVRAGRYRLLQRAPDALQEEAARQRSTRNDLQAVLEALLGDFSTLQAPLSRALLALREA